MLATKQLTVAIDLFYMYIIHVLNNLLQNLNVWVNYPL